MLPAEPSTGWRHQTWLWPLVAATTLFLIGNACRWYLYDRATSALEHEVLQGTLNVAQSAVSTLDPAALNDLQRPEMEQSPSYQRNFLPLHRLLSYLHGVRYLYTARLVGDQVVFLVDGTPPGDADRDGVDDHAYLLSPYPETPSELLTCLRDGKPITTPTPYTDKWGTFVSAYVPVTDATGDTVACLGVDLDAKSYVDRISTVHYASMTTTVFLSIVSLVVFFLVRRMMAIQQQHTLATAALVSSLRTSNTELDKARTQAEAANQAKSAFLATMSHEIRSPLHAILGFNRLAQQRAVDPDLRAILKRTDQGAQLLLEVINDILDLSKAESGKIVLESIPIDIEETLQAPFHMATELAREKGLQMTYDIPENIPWVIGDPTRLRQIAMNLLGNAVKFTDQGTVGLHVALENEQTLILQVSDTGIGMPPERIQRLGTPFEQADSTIARKYGGTGLGWSITHTLVALMKGTWSVQSEVGKGTIVTLWFPVTPCQAPIPPPTAAPPEIAGRRILVVDDNPVNQLLATAVLEHWSCMVETATSGREALEKLTRNSRFDVVLMDVQMPELDGLETTRQIRKFPHCARLPIIGVSANGQAEDQTLATAAGMSEYLIKPYTHTALLHALTSALSLPALK